MMENEVIAFCEETREQLGACTAHVLGMEQGSATRSSQSDLARRLHSVKGTARMMGFADLADAAHALEDAIAALQTPSNDGLPHEVVDVLLTVLDAMTDYLDALQEGSPLPSLVPAAEVLSSVRTLLREEEWPELGRLQQIAPWLPRLMIHSQMEILLRRHSAYPLTCIVECAVVPDQLQEKAMEIRSYLQTSGEVISLTAREDGNQIRLCLLALSRVDVDELSARLPEASITDLSETTEPPLQSPGVDREFTSSDISEEFQRLQAWFLEESHEQLAKLGALILSLERGVNPEAVDEIFRTFHNLKGSGASFGYVGISRIAHVCESFFQPWRIDPGTITPVVIDRLLACLDALESVCRGASESEESPAQIDELEANLLDRLAIHEEPEPRSAVMEPVDPSRTTSQASSVRVSTKKLDSVVKTAAEIAVSGHADEQALSRISEVVADVSHILREWKSVDALLDGSLVPDAVRTAAATVSSSMERHMQRLEDLLAHQDKGTQRRVLLSSALNQEMRAMAMQPVSVLLESMERVVRDTARSLGKRVRFSIQDNGVEADRSVLDQLRDPLVHILRNAVDHGIECPEDRITAGKEAEGVVEIRVQEQGFRFVLSVIDDGAGVDTKAVREKLVERGVLSAETMYSASEESVLMAVFTPGMTTRDTVSTFSGRGVGMDVVGTAVRDLGGEVRIQSVPGQGTTIEMELPIFSALTHALIIPLHPYVFSLPLAPVRKLMAMEPEMGSYQVDSVSKQESLILEDVLGIARSSVQERTGCVLMDGVEEYSLSLPRVVEEMEIVVRPLPAPARTSPYVTGVAILPDGLLALHLDPLAIYRLGVQTETHHIPPHAEDLGRILVADDSVLARTLMEGILVGNGYSVDSAGDGEEALSFLRRNVYDALVTDLDMPVMDGWKVIAAVRADLALGSLPVVVVTAHEDPDIARKALVHGADACICKGAFDHTNLVATLSRLLKEKAS